MSHHPAFEHHDHPAKPGIMKTCRVCKSAYSHDHNPSRLGICEKCGYKILIILLVAMVIASYIAWIGVL